MKVVQLKITTIILQGVPPLSYFVYLIYLVDVVSVPLTEGNNQNFARGSPTELFFFKAVLGLLRESNEGGATEDNNRNFARGSPTELFLYLISLVGVVSVPLTEANNQNFARGSPT